MKVVSTKLSNEEHNAMLEMVNLLGMNTAGYVRRCIMLDMCGSYEGVDVPIDKAQLLDQMKAINKARFTGSQNRKKETESEQSRDSARACSDFIF